MRDMQRQHLRALGCGALFVGAVFFSTNAAAQSLSTGFDATATLSAGVRYRNFDNGGGPEVVVFPSPCCATTTGANGTWSNPSAVSITYNGSSLSTSAAGTTASRLVGNLGNLNYIQITINKPTPTTSVSISNIALNGGGSLGSASLNESNEQVWKITGATLTSGFTLTGTVTISGLSGGGDSNYIQVEVGYVAPSDSQGPITSSVTFSPVPVFLNALVTVSANVSDETTGNNNVASAEFSVDGAGYQSMTAQDSSFNSPNEDVEGQFTADELGEHEVCVRGTDALGNLGDASCQKFLVSYKFTGFFSPIDNDLVNVSKAGQAIPAKWRITDANDVPILGPASFVNLLSYSIDCTDFSSTSQDTVEEYAGSSGLQNLGDGYWQFNWKTPKDYANTCRAMYVAFQGGGTSPAVRFQFKK